MATALAAPRSCECRLGQCDALYTRGTDYLANSYNSALGVMAWTDGVGIRLLTLSIARAGAGDDARPAFAIDRSQEVHLDDVGGSVRHMAWAPSAAGGAPSSTLGYLAAAGKGVLCVWQVRKVPQQCSGSGSGAAASALVVERIASGSPSALVRALHWHPTDPRGVLAVLDASSARLFAIMPAASAAAAPSTPRLEPLSQLDIPASTAPLVGCSWEPPLPRLDGAPPSSSASMVVCGRGELCRFEWSGPISAPVSGEVARHVCLAADSPAVHDGDSTGGDGDQRCSVAAATCLRAAIAIPGGRVLCCTESCIDTVTSTAAGGGPGAFSLGGMGDSDRAPIDDWLSRVPRRPPLADPHQPRRQQQQQQQQQQGAVQEKEEQNAQATAARHGDDEDSADSDDDVVVDGEDGDDGVIDLMSLRATTTSHNPLVVLSHLTDEELRDGTPTSGAAAVMSALGSGRVGGTAAAAQVHHAAPPPAQLRLYRMVATAAPPAEKTIRGEGLKSAAQSGYGKAVLLTPEVTLANINDDSSSEHDEGSAGAETGESTARLCCVASADCAICTGSNARPATRMVLPELVAYEQVDAGCSMVVVGSHSSSTVLVYAMCNALPRSPLRVIAQLPLPPDRRPRGMAFMGTGDDRALVLLLAHRDGSAGVAAVGKLGADGRCGGRGAAPAWSLELKAFALPELRRCATKLTAEAQAMQYDHTSRTVAGMPPQLLPHASPPPTSPPPPPLPQQQCPVASTGNGRGPKTAVNTVDAIRLAAMRAEMLAGFDSNGGAKARLPPQSTSISFAAPELGQMYLPQRTNVGLAPAELEHAGASSHVHQPKRDFIADISQAARASLAGSGRAANAASATVHHGGSRDFVAELSGAARLSMTNQGAGEEVHSARSPGHFASAQCFAPASENTQHVRRPTPGADDQARPQQGKAHLNADAAQTLALQEILQWQRRMSLQLDRLDQSVQNNTARMSLMEQRFDAVIDGLLANNLT